MRLIPPALAVAPALLLSLLAACTASRIDLPPLAAAPGAAPLPGKFVWHDLITDTPEASRRFYRELFGWQFDDLPGVNYSVIRRSGRAIGGLVDQRRLPLSEDVSQWVPVLAVADVDAAARAARGAGAALLTPPRDLGRRGELAVIADPAGAVLALLQGRDGDPPDTLPEPGEFLWNELWTADPAAAAAFYGGLAPYSVQELSLAPDLRYLLLSSAGRPRAGIRRDPRADSMPMWVSYLRVADRSALEALLDRVEGLGGSVVLPVTARPAGGHLAVITGPSGAGIALQTWPLAVAAAGDA
jgi:predicted enzyme related to lactoylglutathione lyase